MIYPVDFRQVGHITDDEMHRILVKPLQPGTRLTAIFDSCHSGTALDLPYIYSTQGILKEPNLAKEAGQGLLGVIASYSQGDIGGMIKKGMGFFKKATNGEEAHNRALATKTSPADVIMLSGSKDDQTSYVSFLPSILFRLPMFRYICCRLVSQGLWSSPFVSGMSTSWRRPPRHLGCTVFTLNFIAVFFFLGGGVFAFSIRETYGLEMSPQLRIRILETGVIQPSSSTAAISYSSSSSTYLAAMRTMTNTPTGPTQPLPPRQPAPCHGPSSPP